MKGWIKLFRDLLDWEWYQDINATRLLVHLLLTVNYQEKKWKGIIVKPGSIILSWETLSNSVGLSVQQCRTAMDKLIDSKEVTKRSTNKYQVITLVKWEEFQLSEVDDNKQNNSQVTGRQQLNNNQITTTKESKEVKESKKEKKRGPSLAYDLLKLEKPEALNIFEMQHKKQVKEWGKLIKSFNNKIELEMAQNKINFESEELFPRFKGFADRWISNEQKYDKTPEKNSYESGKLGRF